MRVVLTLSLALIALVIVACGGADDASDSDNFPALARDRVSDVLLTPDDLGEDWVTTSADSDFTEAIDLSAECDILEPGVIFPDAAAAERSESMAGPLGQQVISFGAIYPDAAAAEAALDLAPALVDRCEDEFKEAARDAAKNVLDALGVDLGVFANIDVSLEEKDLGSRSDQSLAYRLVVSVGILGNDRRFTLDVVAVRDGQTVGAATYTTFDELLEDDEAMVFDALAEKVAAVQKDLP